MKFFNGKNIISFEDDVLAHFEKNRQLHYSDKEAGGQLYTKKIGNVLSICKATGPRLLDGRGFFSFIPNRRLERMEIKKYYKKGLHFVGDWHTHPQDKPYPSDTDLENIQDCFIKSDHSLEYFVLVIVGRKDFPDGLHVSLHDAEGYIFLKSVS